MKKLMPPLAALCLIAAVTTAPAQDWPAKEPIKVIVPFTPGSATDIVARAVFNQVSQQIGQAVVVENRGGGGTTIGSAAVAHADPDGYTLLVNSTSHVVVASTYAHLSYNVADDFTALTSARLAAVRRYRAHQIQDHGRLPGLRPRQSGGAQLRLERRRHRGPAFHAEYRTRGEHFDDAYTVPRHRRCHVRNDRRPPRSFPGSGAGDDRAGQGRESQRARRLDRAAFALRCPMCRPWPRPDCPAPNYNFWIGAFAPSKTPPQISARLHDEIVKALASPDVKKEITGARRRSHADVDDRFRHFRAQGNQT